MNWIIFDYLKVDAKKGVFEGFLSGNPEFPLFACKSTNKIVVIAKNVVCIAICVVGIANVIVGIVKVYFNLQIIVIPN